MVGHQNLFQLCAAIYVAITNTVTLLTKKRLTQKFMENHLKFTDVKYTGLCMPLISTQKCLPIQFSLCYNARPNAVEY